jgi:glycosyltransferase involved in cell wall biosynthesis
LIPYHLAEQLSARHNIDLLAFYDQPDDPSNVHHYEHFFRSVQLIREPQRSTLAMLSRAIRPGAMFPRTVDQVWSPEMWQAIMAQLAAHHYDVVQLFGGIQVYEYRELVRTLPNLIVPYESYSLYLSRLLVSLTPQTPAPSPRTEGKGKPFWKPLPLYGGGVWGGGQRLMVWAQLQAARLYERTMFNGYSGVVVVSKKDSQMLASLNPNLPLHVIPNGIDLGYFVSAETDPSEPTLLFTGNFDYAPNVDAALYLAQDILPQVKREIPAARLMLVGNNPPETMRNLASADIEVTGRVPDVRPYLQQAAVFVCPLRFGAGIKNKLLEAMAMQKALIATPLSGEGIDLVEGTHVLYGSTSEQLAAATIGLLRDAELRRSMGSANRRLIEMQYTWQRVADQYEALYSEIKVSR